MYMRMCMCMCVRRSVGSGYILPSLNRKGHNGPHPPHRVYHQVSKHLREEAKKIEGKEQLIMTAFAKARA